METMFSSSKIMIVNGSTESNQKLEVSAMLLFMVTEIKYNQYNNYKFDIYLQLDLATYNYLTL